MPHSRFSRSAYAAALLAATALTGLATWQIAPAYAQAAPPAPRSAPIDVGRPAAQALPGFADLVQRVMPAVVTITTTMHQASGPEASPFPADSPQDRMFRQFFGGQGGDTGQTLHALGSGFVVDAKGYIVTNDHVVKDATDVHVTLSDGRELSAKVVGEDARTDLALLQVKSNEALPHLALGNSDAARVGDWVVAVGNPFGLGGTVTAGILSARGREIGQGPYDNFLQIDAPINRGNSGGPLFAQDGTVIGVNTAIFSPSGGSVGIGFAIPSSVVTQVVRQLEAHGKVQRGWLGVSAQTLTPTMASALDLPKMNGALVASVSGNSPAAEAGVKPGDVILAVDGKPVKDPRDLALLVAALPPGTNAPVTVHRDGADKTLTVAIAELRDTDGAQHATADAKHGGSFGLALAPLDDQARKALDLSVDQQGVVVASVRPGSPAAAAGLRPGDVVQSVGNHAVTSPKEAAAALHDAGRKNEAAALRILRDGQSAFVAMEMKPAASHG